jgi:hypothetical protein
MRIKTSLAAIFFLAISASANAMSVTWKFQNAFFNDGTSLTGSFDYDNGRFGPDGYSKVNLDTVARGLMDGRNYTGVTFLSAGIGFTSKVGDQILGVLFDDWIGIGGNPGSSIGASGAEVKLGSLPTAPTTISRTSNDGGGILDKIIGGRYLVRGSLVRDGALALSEPATFALFLLGILAVAGLRLQRRKADSV